MDFFEKSEITSLLLIATAAGGLNVQYDWPQNPKGKACYFVKKSKEPVTKDTNFRTQLLYGDMSQSPLDQLSAFVDEVSEFLKFRLVNNNAASLGNGGGGLEGGGTNTHTKITIPVIFLSPCDIKCAPHSVASNSKPSNNVRTFGTLKLNIKWKKKEKKASCISYHKTGVIISQEEHVMWYTWCIMKMTVMFDLIPLTFFIMWYKRVWFDTLCESALRLVLVITLHVVLWKRSQVFLFLFFWSFSFMHVCIWSNMN